MHAFGHSSNPCGLLTYPLLLLHTYVGIIIGHARLAVLQHTCLPARVETRDGLEEFGFVLQHLSGQRRILQQVSARGLDIFIALMHAATRVWVCWVAGVVSAGDSGRDSLSLCICASVLLCFAHLRVPAFARPVPLVS